MCTALSLPIVHYEDRFAVFVSAGPSAKQTYI